MLGVDDANEINIFLSSINASISLRVNSEAWCEWALKLNVTGPPGALLFDVKPEITLK